MAKHSNIEVICITDKDCPRNAEFIQLLGTLRNGKMIDFYTQDINDLSVIAKYRVLPVPTILVINNGKLIGRIVHPPSTDSMLDLLVNTPLLLK